VVTDTERGAARVVNRAGVAAPTRASGKRSMSTEHAETQERTDDEPTCPNGYTLCPRENPAVADDALPCFDCHAALARYDERVT